MAAADRAIGPLVAQLVGPAGLTFEVFRQLLEGVDVVIVDPDEPSAGRGGEADVIVLIDPSRDDWTAVRDLGIPIVLVQGEEADDAEVVESVLAGADAVLHYDTDPDTVFGVLEQVS